MEEAARLTARMKKGVPSGWRLEISDVARLQKAVTAQVLTAFAMCFLHADRLTSLIGFGYLSGIHYANGSVPRRRDIDTMVWYAAATLRELALAIRFLSSALVKAGLFDNESHPWKALADISHRWEDDKFYREVIRNKIAAHVDKKAVAAGVDAIARAGQPCVFAEGEGRKQRETSLRFGREVLFAGLNLPEERITEFIDKIDRELAVADPLEALFFSIMERIGIDIVKEEGSMDE